MEYTPINARSGYAFFKSALHPEDIVEYALKRGNKSVCLTDRNNMFAALSFATYAAKRNLRYVIGMEIILQEDAETKSALILLAKNEEGYRSLTRLTKTVSVDDLTVAVNRERLQDNLNGLYVILPCLRSLLPSLYPDKEKAISYLETIRRLGGEFVLGLEKYDDGNADFLNFCRALPYPKCVANLARYKTKDDAKTIDILQAIKNNAPVAGYKKRNEALENDDYLRKVFSAEELEANAALLETIDFDIFRKKASLISYPLTEEGGDKRAYLRRLCVEGLKKRLKDNLSDAYLRRLDYELGVIDKMGYTNYFLVVWDYVNFAREHDILVGPGRGSGAGALTSYALRITDVDPLKYGLLFERFLNPERVSMPDLDVDFIDSGREDVVNYLFAKYGEDHVARVVSFQTFRTRQSLRDAAKALNASETELTAILRRLPKGAPFIGLQTAYEQYPSFRDFINARRINREIYDVARKLEGLPRQTSQMSGVVLSEETLADVVPIYKTGTINCTQYPKNYIEEVGLLKMDILALTDLAVIDETRKAVQRRRGVDLDLSLINYDDPRLYRLINGGYLAGLFQISSEGMSKAIRRVKPTCFNDLVTVIALFRPGPMEFIDVYARCKNERAPVDYIDDSIKSILTPTYGIIVYQEQIMEILRAFAGFSLGEADIVRRAIAKKSQAAMEEFKKNFTAKALALGRDPRKTERVRDLIAKFAGYGFNKAHSVSYAMATGTMAYLKAYYPREFYCACLDRYNGNEGAGEFANLLREMKRLGVAVLPPRINLSGAKFNSERAGVRFSYRNIKGMSFAAIQVIVAEQNKRPFADFYDFMTRTYRLGVDVEQVRNMIMAGVFDDFGVSRADLAYNLDDIVNYVDIVRASKGGLFAVGLSERPVLTHIEENEEEKRANERAVLGDYFLDYPFEKERAKFARHGYAPINEALKKKGTVKIVAYARRVRVIKTKNGDEMALVSLCDRTGEITAVLFPDFYRENASLIRQGASYYVAGEIKARYEKDVSLIVRKIAVYGAKRGSKR